MEVTEKTAKYIYKSIVALCITAVICLSIFAFSNRYHSYPTRGGSGIASSAYLVDKWTGKVWHIWNNSLIPVKEE